MENIGTILEYWFGNDPDDGAVAKDKSTLWWSKNQRTDEEIRSRFGALAPAAEAGLLDGWRGSPEGRLALILVTDQFPRNSYRDSPQAFRFDPIARRLCLEGLESGAHRLLRPIHRVFFYLPLEHSEDREHQARSVALFQALAADVPDALKTTFDNFLEFAVRHQVIIDRFGRFPHRNAVLGRPSTSEELEFLEQPGSSF